MYAATPPVTDDDHQLDDDNHSTMQPDEARSMAPSWLKPLHAKQETRTNSTRHRFTTKTTITPSDNNKDEAKNIAPS